MNETALIVHEIKQPLTAIHANARYCLRELEGPAPNRKKLREAIQDIVDESHRAMSIVSEIRALLTDEVAERVMLNLNDVLCEVLCMLRSEAVRDCIQLTTNLSGKLLAIVGNRIQLQQAFRNVIMNSIEALRSGSERQRSIVIESEACPEGSVIEVRDSGPGVDRRVSERIFDPRFTTKQKGMSMGLGLSISRAIVEAHGGQLFGIAIPDGALFRFVFPTPTDPCCRR